MHHFPPTAVIGAFRKPLPPILDGAPEQFVALLFAQAKLPFRAVAGKTVKLKAGALSFIQSELAEDARAFPLQRNVARHRQVKIRRVEFYASFHELGLVPVESVVERRPALDLEGHRSANHLDPANEPVVSVTALGDHRHVIDDLAHSIR